ncbi:hypothetical protein J4Q44_G00387430 [Coregonus suidteri]|uniref:Uncharacterized protein n=1 Tax=Coregonus suidteri TaxID=861788 RepID=A0AAN8Q942_9TELE
MACGATLKRSMEFEALLSPQSPKRRRCNALPGAPSTPSPQRCNLRPPVDCPSSHSMSPPAMGGEHRLTPVLLWCRRKTDQTDDLSYISHSSSKISDVNSTISDKGLLPTKPEEVDRLLGAFSCAEVN